MAPITFTVADPASAAARWAMSRYFDELEARFTDGFDPGTALDEAATAFRPPSGEFVLAERDGITVACGAVQHLDDVTGEIKRMWVSGDARGAGLGRRLLAHLEDRLRAAGRTRAVLDTNGALLEAIAMYRSCGYHEIERYNDNPYAQLWFAKDLGATGG